MIFLKSQIHQLILFANVNISGIHQCHFGEMANKQFKFDYSLIFAVHLFLKQLQLAQYKLVISAVLAIIRFGL